MKARFEGTAHQAMKNKGQTSIQSKSAAHERERVLRFQHTAMIKTVIAACVDKNEITKKSNKISKVLNQVS